MFSIFYLAQETIPASCSSDLVSSVKWVYWMGARELLEAPTGSERVGVSPAGLGEQALQPVCYVLPALFHSKVLGSDGGDLGQIHCTGRLSHVAGKDSGQTTGLWLGKCQPFLSARTTPAAPPAYWLFPVASQPASGQGQSLSLGQR